jgi:hypothetical protein
MKSIISTGIALAIGLSSVSGALAMEAMTGEAMMMKDAMVKEEGAMMMKDNGMMKTDAMVKTNGRMTPSKIAAKYGYVWSRDKAKLAVAAGIKNYRGTVRQNLMIAAYLKKSNTMMKDSMMKDSMMKDEGAMMMKEEGAMMQK